MTQTTDVIYEGEWPTPEGTMRLTVECPPDWTPEQRQRMGTMLADQFDHVKATERPGWYEFGETAIYGAGTVVASMPDESDDSLVRVVESQPQGRMQDGQPILVDFLRQITVERKLWRSALADAAKEHGATLDGLTEEGWALVRQAACDTIMKTHQIQWKRQPDKTLVTRDADG